MPLSNRATPVPQGACTTPSAQVVFSAAALWWVPTKDDTKRRTKAETDEQYAARVAALEANYAARQAAEEAAVEVCMECPIFAACQQWEEDQFALGKPVGGVVAGRTEAERKAMRAPAGTPEVKNRSLTSVPNPQIAPGDRGPRNQIDDTLVRLRTLEGRSAEAIALEMGCSQRSVNRARKRMGLTKSKNGTFVAVDEATDATTAETGIDSVDQRVEESPVAPLVQRTPANPVSPDYATNLTMATFAAASKSTRRTAKAAPGTARASASGTADKTPFSSGRPISAAMEAVYDRLAAADGGYVDKATLIAAGVSFVDVGDAVNKWVKVNSVPDPATGQKVLKPSKAATAYAERVEKGAYAIVYNSLSAAERLHHHLVRDGDMFAFAPGRLDKWRERMAARAGVV